MSKIGPKEAQRLALRERNLGKGVVRHAAVDSDDDTEEPRTPIEAGSPRAGAPTAEDIERGLRLLEARRRRNREYQRRVREDAAAMRRAREKGQ